MSVPFECSGCGFKSKVKDELQGKKIKCPKCQQPAIVGAGGSSKAAPKKKSASESEDGLLAINLESFEDVELEEGEVLEEKVEKAPKKKKKKKGAPQTPLPGSVVAATVLFCAISVGVMAGLGIFVVPQILEAAARSAEASKTAPAAPAGAQAPLEPPQPAPAQ